MAPSRDTLAQELRDTAAELFASDDRDRLSVNLVRSRVQDKLNLDGGFFFHGPWKARSKELIVNIVDELFKQEKDADDVKTEPSPPAGIKRQSPDHSPQPKRRKRESSTPVRAKVKVKRADSDSEEEGVSKKAKVKEVNVKKEARGRKGKKRNAVESDEASPTKKDDDDDATNGVDGDIKEKLEDESEEEKPTAAAGAVKKDESDDDDGVDVKPDIKPDVKTETKAEVPEEDDYSDVIDEPPPPKRMKKESKEPKVPKSKKSRSSASASTPSDPNDQEIKKLQSQLVKCGVRKIWGIELKPHGTDARAKIRHLRDMLKDLGMEGRFSEAKAKEIKERRELMADLEAVTEMNSHWGADGGRASRSRTAGAGKKKVKSESEDSDIEGANADPGAKKEESDDDGVAFKPKRVRASRASLAFLGDDDESESD